MSSSLFLLLLSLFISYSISSCSLIHFPILYLFFFHSFEFCLTKLNSIDIVCETINSGHTKWMGAHTTILNMSVTSAKSKCNEYIKPPLTNEWERWRKKMKMKWYQMKKYKTATTTKTAKTIKHHIYQFHVHCDSGSKADSNELRKLCVVVLYVPPLWNSHGIHSVIFIVVYWDLCV